MDAIRVTGRPSLLAVEEALARILASAAHPLSAQTVPLAAALGRTLATPLAARRSQPPFAASAMDGYAVRAADIKTAPVTLTLIGESRAGHGFAGRLCPGEAVRIFTGAPVPAGADTIVLQEEAGMEAGRLLVPRSEPEDRYVRRAGLDFSEGALLLNAGTRLGPVELALAGAMNYPQVPVVRAPRVAIVATGDELVEPGEPMRADQIVTSNAVAVAGLVEEAGGLALYHGIAGDNPVALADAVERAQRASADILVTLGGASVGDHDLVQEVLVCRGMRLDFWKIAMRPGKPLIHGSLGDMRVLGLPGNPVSAIVCALIFLRPLIRALLGDRDAAADPSEPAILGAPLDANDRRQDYLRAALHQPSHNLPVATAFDVQDSSMLWRLAEARCLIVRPPLAGPAVAGSACRIIRL
jgi:molybdopterin molybdotransferase